VTSTSETASSEEVKLLDDREEDERLASQATPWEPLFRSPIAVLAMTLGGAVGLGCAISSGGPGSVPGAAAWIILSVLLAVLAVIDVRTLRLPFVFTGPLAACMAVLAVAHRLGDADVAASLGFGAAGAGLTFTVSLALAWWGRLGPGDIPLAVAITLALSLAGGPVAIAALIFFPGIVAAALIPAYLLSRLLGRAVGPVPFGPFLAAGALLAMLLREPVMALFIL